MATSKDVEIPEGSTTENPFECTSVPGPLNGNENSAFTESCPAILEPSKDKARSQEEENTRNVFEIFSAPPPSRPTFVPALVGSDSILSFDFEELRNEEQQRKRRCPPWCNTIINRYRKSAITFRNSRFFYIFQFLLCLPPISAMAIGIKFVPHCTSFFPMFTLIIGIVGAFLVSAWISISVLHHFGRRCTLEQKFFVGILFILLMILLVIEMALFFSISPIFDPSDRKHCGKTFIDYTFYKYIAFAGSLLLAVMIYFPDYQSYICSFECTMPIERVLYDQM